MAKMISKTTGCIAAMETILHFLGQYICPGSIELKPWIDKSIRITDQAKYIRDKEMINDFDQLPDQSIICYDLTSGILPQSTHYAIWLNGMIVEFGPNQLSKTNGAVHIKYPSNKLKWYYPRDSYFTSWRGFIPERLSTIRELTYFGRGVYPTDVGYNPALINCQHFISLLGGQYYSPEADGMLHYRVIRSLI